MSACVKEVFKIRYIRAYSILCLSIYLSIYIYISISIYLSVCLSVCLHTYLPTYVPTYLHTVSNPPPETKNTMAAFRC